MHRTEVLDKIRLLNATRFLGSVCANQPNTI